MQEIGIQNRTKSTDKLASRFVIAVGKCAMPNGRLVKPKCYGRCLRMVAKYYATFRFVQDGILKPGHVESIFGVRHGLKDEYIQFADKIGRQKSVAPKRLIRIATQCADFHASLIGWKSLDISDIQRLNRNALSILGPEIVLSISRVEEQYRAILLDVSSLSIPLQRDDR